MAEKAEAEEAAKAASLEAPPTYTSSQVAGRGGGEAEAKKYDAFGSIFNLTESAAAGGSTKALSLEASQRVHKLG